MDTPEKNQIPANTSSISKFEDSPVFNYISNLSPIEPIKSVQSDHTFNTVSFASSPSVFTSPQISSHKESRFLIRSVCAATSHDKNKNYKNEEEFQGAVQQSDKDSEQIVHNAASGTSAGEINEQTIELPNALKYDCESPDSNEVPCNSIKMDTTKEITCMANSKERHNLFGREIELRKLCWIEKNKKIMGCDWLSLISNDLLDFDLSLEDEHPVGQDHTALDPGTVSFVSSILQLPQDNVNDLQKEELVGHVASCEQCQIGEPKSQYEDQSETEEKSIMPERISSTLLDRLALTDISTKVNDRGKEFVQSSIKLGSHKLCSIRRRCLVFEGALSKKPVGDSNGSSSVSLQSDFITASNEKHLVEIKTGNGYSSSKLPAIGLHLNTLGTTSSDGRLIDSERPPLNFLAKSMTQDSLGRDSYSSENEAHGAENAPQTSYGISEEFEHDSPERKRFKLENVEETGACKRCNCKRSKCLKLYCECFAAGLYCIEPCACQDCFNQPIHENTVLETRRQIESRNPLAFAPKVIRNVNAVPDSRDEISTTPASARHKRGCNCKKSGCLKKYCECYQGGAGCSVSCRCVGCRNTFGQRDGPDEIEHEVEDSEAIEKNALDMNPETIQERRKELPDPPKTITELSRPALKLPFTLCRKLSISSLPTVGSPSKNLYHQPNSEKCLEKSPEDETSRTTTNSNHSHSSGVHSISPNSKRVTAWRSGRKLILRSIPSFPSLDPP